MKTRTALALALLTFGPALAEPGTALAQPAPAPATAPAASPADAALASRLAQLAQTVLLAREPGQAHFLETAALLQAAAKLDPTEPRYPRLLADAMRQLGDATGAIDALVAYRKLRPHDPNAQIELIELYLNRIETVEKKLAYLKDLRANNGIPPEIRSQLSLHAARLLLERGEDDAARTALKEATTLDPLNGTAWSLHKAMLPPDDFAGRFTATLNVLRADPAQPELLASVARDLADAGLANDSLRWYAWALVTGSREPESLLLEYASELLIAEQLPEARKRLDALVAANPENYPAAAMRLAVARRDGANEDVTRLSNQARNILLNRLATVRKAMGVAEATTRPVLLEAGPIPALDADVDRWKNLPDESIKEAYLQAVGDLAWFEVYFDSNPAEAEKLLRHFSMMAGETNAFAARTAGWIFMAQNRPDEAKVKLTAAAPTDAYAAAGLLKLLPPEERPKASAEASKVLATAPSGPTGALLAEALREFNAKPTPGPRAPALTQALKSFPLEWVSIVQSPRQFYTLRAEPLKVSYDFGEPLWVRVVLTNLGRYEIRIAPDGLIKPGIWSEIQLQGLFRAAAPLQAFERLSEHMVLRPRQTITLMARMDVPQLTRFLDANPMPSIPLAVTVRTNPTMLGDKPASTPGGYAVDLSRAMERGASPIQPHLPAAMQALTGGPGDQRIRAAQLLDAYHRVIVQQLSKQRDADLEQLDQKVREALDKARADEDLSVRAFASLVFATGSRPDEAPPALLRMTLDPVWTTRLLGVIGAQLVPSERSQTMIAELIERETDPIVKRAAQAALTQLRDAAAAPPAAPAAPSGSAPGASPARAPGAPR